MHGGTSDASIWERNMFLAEGTFLILSLEKSASADCCSRSPARSYLVFRARGQEEGSLETGLRQVGQGYE